MSELLKDLNTDQQKAVTASNGPVLIIAGAGSGKTRALTQRIAYLIKEKKVSPWNILAVTFTNKAATEMKERVMEVLGTTVKSDIPTIGTFHSICVQILRQDISLLGRGDNFVIFDSSDQQILMKRIMKDNNFNTDKLNHKAVLNHISGAKNMLTTPEKYNASFTHNYFTEQVGKLYALYQKGLEKNNALDFDDLIMKTVELFQKEPRALDKYQEKFRFISVDEYQDTNHAQYLLTKLLAQKYRNICVVGDDWQSIYSWRGADMQNILDFNKDYPEAVEVLLEQNYRSSQNILDAGQQVIEKNKKRTDKRLWTEADEGEKIRVWTAMDERDEGSLLLREIENVCRAEMSPNYSKFAVLYRTNAQSRVLEEGFMRYGIPYRIIGGVKFYERKEIKDILAYLRVIQNQMDEVSLMRIINVPSRKLGATTLESIHQFAIMRSLSLFEAMEQVEENMELSESKRQVIKRFAKDIKELQKANKEFAAAGVIKHVIADTGYKEFLLDGTAEGEARFENVQELISVAGKYELLEPGLSLATFLEEVSLISDVDQLDKTDNVVTLMTLHSAKGLEFENVFMVGLEEGLFPHSRTLFEQDELEEERRLMYVGITRARKNLYLMHAKKRLLYGETKTNAPSQFLHDIEDELIETNEKKVEEIRSVFNPIPIEGEDAISDSEDFTDGDKVAHPSFGEGIVVNATGGVVTVAFKSAKYGIKKLAISIAPLKRV